MQNNKSSFRAFFAIEIPDEIKKTIAAIINPLKTNLTLQQIKWVRLANWHITLCFLGNISEQQYQCIDQKIKTAIIAINNFRIELTKLGPFPSDKEFHVISLEPKTSVTLATLALTIEDNIRACGIQIKNRPFRPHLTIGRIKNKNATKTRTFSNIFNNIKLPPMSFNVTAIKLFRSDALKEKSSSNEETTSTESVYTEVAAYELNQKI